MTEQATQKAQDFKETAQQMTDTMKDTAQEWTERARGTARDAGAAADLYVHEYAWTTVSMVAVFALAIGFLLGRRQS